MPTLNHQVTLVMKTRTTSTTGFHLTECKLRVTTLLVVSKQKIKALICPKPLFVGDKRSSTPNTEVCSKTVSTMQV